MRCLDSLQVHQGLHAGEEHEARALAGQHTDGAEHPGWHFSKSSVLTTDHQSGHGLSDHNKDAADQDCFLWVEPLEQEAGQDAEKGGTVQHKVKPVGDVLGDLVLLRNMIEVTGSSGDMRSGICSQWGQQLLTYMAR